VSSLLASSMCTSRSTLTVSFYYSTKLISSLTLKAIVAIFKKYPKVAISLVIEPDSLPNLVTNSNVQQCQAAASGYRDGVAYALKQLNLPNVAMYLDAGHGGWLGWPDNLRTSSSPPSPHSPSPH
jgi:cellulase/cellobiase CelA1